MSVAIWLKLQLNSRFVASFSRDAPRQMSQECAWCKDWFFPPQADSLCGQCSHAQAVLRSLAARDGPEAEDELARRFAGLSVSSASSSDVPSSPPLPKWALGHTHKYEYESVYTYVYNPYVIVQNNFC